MPKTASINARVDATLKSEAEAVLRQVGLSTSDVITLLLRQIVMHKGVPFDVRVPNAETVAAMRDAGSGVGMKSYAGTSEMWADIDAEAD